MMLNNIYIFFFQVLFVTRVKKYSEHERQQFKPIWKTNIFFESDEVHQMFIKLLAHSCSFCPNREPEPTFQALKVHMRQQHQRFCCDLCVKHLQVFSHGRKVLQSSCLMLKDSNY